MDGIRLGASGGESKDSLPNGRARRHLRRPLGNICPPDGRSMPRRSCRWLVGGGGEGGGVCIPVRTRTGSPLMGGPSGQCARVNVYGCACVLREFVCSGNLYLSLWERFPEPEVTRKRTRVRCSRTQQLRQHVPDALQCHPKPVDCFC